MSDDDREAGSFELTEASVLAEGIGFPEGPVWLADGSLALCDIRGGAVLRITAVGEVRELARTPGPNGLAAGRDGTLYVADNGGYFDYVDAGTGTIPVHGGEDRAGGAILRIDPDGTVTTVADRLDGHPLVAPNDLVLDADGGIWFTDHGVRWPRPDVAGDPDAHRDRPGLLWCRTDGSGLRGVAWGLDAPNGVGRSPDGATVYVAETYRGTLTAFDVDGPGAVEAGGGPGRAHGGRVLHAAAEGVLFDSLAVDASGWIWVATIGPGGITCVPPHGGEARHVATDDFLTTNLAWGGEDLRTVAVTLSSSGRVLVGRTGRAGLAPAF